MFTMRPCYQSNKTHNNMIYDPKIYPPVKCKPEKKARFDPEPGRYRAVLRETTRFKSKKGDVVIKFCWELLSHPSEEFRYLVYRDYYPKSIGLLGMCLRHWKGHRWRTLRAEEDGEMKSLRYLASLTGEMADIEVSINEVNGKQYRNVESVDRPGERVDHKEPMASF